MECKRSSQSARMSRFEASGPDIRLLSPSLYPPWVHGVGETAVFVHLPNDRRVRIVLLHHCPERRVDTNLRECVHLPLSVGGEICIPRTLATHLAAARQRVPSGRAVTVYRPLPTHPRAFGNSRRGRDEQDRHTKRN